MSKSTPAKACNWSPEIASRCVVPVRAKASLTSGSIPSRWPRMSAAASGATDGSSRSKSRARLHDRIRPSTPVKSEPLPLALRQKLCGSPTVKRRRTPSTRSNARKSNSPGLSGGARTASKPAASTAWPARISVRSPVTIVLARPEALRHDLPSLDSVRSSTKRVETRDKASLPKPNVPQTFGERPKPHAPPREPRPDAPPR